MNKQFTKPLITLFLCLVVLGFTNPAGAQFYANPQDSLTLVEFQRAMMEKGWPQFWDTTKPVEEWRGAYLDYITGEGANAAGRIKWVDINGNWFSPSFTTDSLPACINILRTMDSLESVAFNNFELKYLPEEICELSNIETLSLGYNSFTEIPSFIGRLNNLQQLFLNSNQLTDLPDELSGLTNLTHLTLSSNKTLTKIPDVVTKLPALIKLIVYYSPITTLPAEIKNLQHLEELRVNNCSLTSLPDEIGKLTSLKYLYAGSNQLTSLPEAIGNLQNLESIQVYLNNLTELPQSFSNLTNLQGIQFYNNRFASFPACLATLPKLTGIKGENNQMEGSIPAELFNKTDLRLYVNNNNLSGNIAMQRNKKPSRLHIAGNRFTFKDLFFDNMTSADYAWLNEELRKLNYSIQPQQNIGTFRTFTPKAGESLSFGIDNNYDPAEGSVHTWYRLTRISGDNNPVQVATGETLTIGNFDPAADAGVYYCVVTHPGLSRVSLESNRVCVIGDTDAAPSLTAGNVLFRRGKDAMLYLTVSDDYTPAEEMVYSIPDTSRHFILRPDSLTNYPNNRYIFPKEGVLLASDTLEVSITDRAGNIASTKVVITMLPSENEPPQMDFPVIYMNFAFEPPSCIPELPDCNDVYYFASSTFLKNYVSDDFTSEGNLTYSVALNAISGTLPPDNIANVNLMDELTGEGLNTAKSLYVLVSAVSDIEVSVTLTVTDSEGGTNSQQIILKGIGLSTSPDAPNDLPQIAPIPDQVIERGTTAFPPLNLKDYITDDYLSFEELEITLYPRSLVATIQEDSLLYVSPLYPESVYVEHLVLSVRERSNLLSENIAEIIYRIEDTPLTAAIIITDGFSVSVYPNPAGEQVTVAFRLEKADSVSLSLIDMQGKTVCTPAKVECPEGTNAVPLDVSGLDKGIYFLKVEAGATTETIKLMVK